ncbi:adenylate/guanylate cyclase domain-containing protein [Congregibacter brevis]|uniref:Adenylate/guanylate cyclase domain-containing protein n=1 Tax=Congregibacter brevis TaxID=3081201 RepID=A0ABZ0IJB3_9GAMM|nr:adenylate/guanylate cyclase domain-containing protein [Congregibacter sp. IMCC45268]
MADLRGFSNLAGTTAPDVLVGMLQPFFTEMTRIIHEHGGYIDKFLGDGIMALFGAPENSQEHAGQAISCAAAMQDAMHLLNRGKVALRIAPLYMGIGVSSGEVMAGSFGSEKYHEYTVIGDAVNIAARLEKFALRGEVLLSDSCYQAAREELETDRSRDIHVRGQSKPITVHKLRAVLRPKHISIPEVEVRTSPRVDVDLPLKYQTIKNRRALSESHEGKIINLGYGGMLANLASPLPADSEIVFGINPAPTSTQQEEVYAKALHHHETADGFQTAFAFTAIGDLGRDAVHSCVDQVLLSF